MSGAPAGEPVRDLAVVGSLLRHLNAESIAAADREAWAEVAELDRRRCVLVAALTGEQLARDPALARALLSETLEATRLLERSATAARDRLGEALRKRALGKRATDLYGSSATPNR